MKQRAGIGALLLVCVGVVLGATVFRSDIAQATGLAQSVVVSNTASQAVPVREQNLDGGNIKVHEQGTANVAVKSTPAATRFFRQSYIISAGELRSWDFDALNAATVIASVQTGTVSFRVFRPESDPSDFGQPIILSVVGPSTVTIPLNETIALDGADANCLAGTCYFTFSIIGH
jgi:hypothetical protein